MHKGELEKFVIHRKQTIRQAMEAINNNWREIVFVEDEEKRIVGTVTDGDVRRGLLAGLDLGSPAEEIMNNVFISVGLEVDRITVLDLMKAHSISQVPLLDADKRLVGIHFLPDLIGASIKPNIAIIMAGGKGTRLTPLTENCPKPMIKVAGRPILERLVLHLVGYGIRNIYIAINYLGDMIEEHFNDGSSLGCSIKYIREQTALGTGGALSLLPHVPEEPFLVMNGDLVTQLDIAKLLDFHIEEKADATIAARPYQIDIPYGVIQEQGNRLVRLHEKPTDYYLVNTGTDVLNPSVISLIPKNEEFPITSLFDKLIEQNRSIGVYLSEEDWIDIGRHEELRKANGIL